MFKRATKTDAKLRMALTGPSGSGKTYTALNIATAMGGKIALIDTERGSASKYADLFEFDVLELVSFHPHLYIEAIREAEKAGYAFLIIDSLSHAWMGKDGALELVDRASKASKSLNTFVAWREITPIQNNLVDAITGSKCHVIATMRTKTEYAQDKDDRGKTTIHKIGLAPIQREGLEHEFDVVGELDHQNTMVISKTRCPDLHGAVIEKPGKEISEILVAWLKGEPPPPPPAPPPIPPKNSTVPPIEMQKAIEASLLKAGIAKDSFREYLASLNWLPLTEERGKYILENFKRAVDAWEKWNMPKPDDASSPTLPEGYPETKEEEKILLYEAQETEEALIEEEMASNEAI